ncbi:MAG TPA: MOSC N-terminal beta barrel domain-containing protein [Acidimicrobiales bacterium]|nr:MOSC N-terminal beta barrel domain-containing protein [Acidimicrobiales bacterium]
MELWRYPVKSMQGERVDTAGVGPRGLLGDRRWAVVDLTTGLALTARREPRLLFATARLGDDRGDTVAITLPDGSTADGDADLSAWLGHPVALRRAAPDVHGTYEIATDPEDEDGSPWVTWDGPSGSFHDSGRTQVSIASTASIGAWDRRRFRANVVVDGRGEDQLIGRTIGLGTADVEVVKRIDRCVVTTRPQPDGIERDVDVLRTINAERDGCLGIGAVVRTPGRVTIGDELTLVSSGVTPPAG